MGTVDVNVDAAVDRLRAWNDANNCALRTPTWDINIVLDALAEAQKARDGFERLWIDAGKVIDRNRARADAAESKLARIAERVAELQQSDDRAWVSNIGDGLALILNEGTETK